jgi:Ser/Thr protein kinase RdoA (MazF antagonist)
MTEETAARIWREATGKAPDAVVRLPTGACNYVFRVEEAGRKRILRLARKENAAILGGSLYWIGKLAPLDLSIPKIIGANLESDPPYAILSYIEGEDLGHAYGRLTEDEKREIAREVVRAQKAVARLPQAAGYGFLSSYEDPGVKETWRDVVADSLARSRSRIRENKIFDERYVDRVEGFLADFADYFSTIQPIPFFDDATTKNVLVHDGRFSGLVDLDWICFGDRVFTIALTRMSLLSSHGSPTYIDYLVAEENLSAAQLRALDFYTTVFCVDFMGELGMAFNRETAPVPSEESIADLKDQFEALHERCRL